MASKAAQLVQLIRSTKREKRLGTVILFVTSRCNSLCRTCFYHNELNQPGDMTFEEIEKVSLTMPPITDLWLSGGEPTLRHDASEISTCLCATRRAVLIIPTTDVRNSVCNRRFALVGLSMHLYELRRWYGQTPTYSGGPPGRRPSTREALYPLKKSTTTFRLNVNTVVARQLTGSRTRRFM